MRMSTKSLMGMIMMKRMNRNELIIVEDRVGGIEKLGIEKMGLLSLEGMQEELLGGLRIEKIVVWVVLRLRFHLFKVRMIQKLTLN